VGHDLSWRDLIFGAGGVFLLTKSTREIHDMAEGENSEHRGVSATLTSAVIQIALFDIVFSIDSVVTAVGMSEHLAIMIIAVVLAMLVMLVASGPVGEFVERHPTVKMLALSFLLLIGTALIADALHFHIPRGYLYFAVAFSGLVEMLNQFVAGDEPDPKPKAGRTLDFDRLFRAVARRGFDQGRRASDRQVPTRPRRPSS